MAYTLRARVAAILSVTEFVDSSTSPGSGDVGNRRVYDQYSTELTLTGDGTFPEIAGQVADLSHTLSGGTTKDFDLQAVPWAGDISKTFSADGKKPVAIIFRFNKGNNAAGVTLGPTGANGYALFGAGISPKFFPGWNLVLFLADPDQAEAVTNNLPAIGAAAKDLRFTGTDGDGWKCLLVFSE